ncbi:MAG: PrsW family intramembrane metalloprotease [Bacteroidetes bacterium]|nr:MAG: PrsW family intramembrane metalloprotease [Bacteroidota bacterium]
MSPRTLQCRQCGQHFQESGPGDEQAVRCPHCGHEFSPLETPLGKLEHALRTRLAGLRTGLAQLARDIGEMDLRHEILPFDERNVRGLSRDFVFWAVIFLGIVPLLIVTIEGTDAQLTLFALFFALVWGVIFKRFILNDDQGWQWPLAALFFTGIAGIGLLLLLYRFFPEGYLALPDHESPLLSLLGFVFQVGVWEELIKALPLLLVLRLTRGRLSPLHLVTIGVFSGLGFAAFENLSYGEKAVASTHSMAEFFGEEGLSAGVQRAMIITMLRALSLVFCHAVFSGIVAYFVAKALLEGEKMGAHVVVGIAAASILHGLYDWLAVFQSTLAALLAGLSFAMFYGYLSRLKVALLLKADIPEALPGD